MKTKVFKFVLPVFALFLAVSFAFAAEESNTAQTGYYNHPILGVQSIMTDCPRDGVDPCKFGAFPVYADQSLTIPLKKRQ